MKFVCYTAEPIAEDDTGMQTSKEGTLNSSEIARKL